MDDQKTAPAPKDKKIAGIVPASFINFMKIRASSASAGAKRAFCLAVLASVSTITAQPAKAVLTYNIFENGGNVIAEASGNLILPATTFLVLCHSDPATGGYFESSGAVICTGAGGIPLNAYNIAGPVSFGGSPGFLSPANSFAGTSTAIVGSDYIFAIDSSYSSGDTISGSAATFNGVTLASLGFTTTGWIGTWTLQPADGSDPYTAYDTIKVCIGTDPCTESVPAPLPLLGAGAAFCWSRRLRRRAGLGPLSQPKT